MLYKHRVNLQATKCSGAPVHFNPCSTPQFNPYSTPQFNPYSTPEFTLAHGFNKFVRGGGGGKL